MYRGMTYIYYIELYINILYIYQSGYMFISLVFHGTNISGCMKVRTFYFGGLLLCLAATRVSPTVKQHPSSTCSVLEASSGCGQSAGGNLWLWCKADTRVCAPLLRGAARSSTRSFSMVNFAALLQDAFYRASRGAYICVFLGLTVC